MTPGEAILSLLDTRGPGKTICPSEAARLAAPDANEWRDMMPAVHAEVEDMANSGQIVLTWKGEPREPGQGPYRIAKAVREAGKWLS